MTAMSLAAKTLEIQEIWLRTPFGGTRRFTVVAVCLVIMRNNRDRIGFPPELLVACCHILLLLFGLLLGITPIRRYPQIAGL